MPRKTREGLIPYEEQDQKEYHRLYYKKNRDLIAAKYKQIKQNLLYEEVKNWKQEKLNDPNAFSPFYNS